MNARFEHELTRYGPNATFSPPSLAAARTYCSQFARSHYENFSVVTALLPRRLVPHFYAVYSYCRWADDLGDESGSGQRALELLSWWRGELKKLYEGEARHPIMVALKPTIDQFHIPQKPFADLIFAFEQDQIVKRYATFSQLLDYCRHSADPVGRILLYLFESFTPENAELSDRICSALQLTNFWQDVSRDLAIGRVYLPTEDMTTFGYDDADLSRRRFSPQFASLLRFEVQRTREMFQQGAPLIGRVPREVQVDVELFLRGGVAILDKIEAQGYDVWHRRPKLAKWEKARLLGGAIVRKWAGPWISPRPGRVPIS